MYSADSLRALVSCVVDGVFDSFGVETLSVAPTLDLSTETFVFSPSTWAEGVPEVSIREPSQKVAVEPQRSVVNFFAHYFLGRPNSNGVSKYRPYNSNSFVPRTSVSSSGVFVTWKSCIQERKLVLMHPTLGTRMTPAAVPTSYKSAICERYLFCRACRLLHRGQLSVVLTSRICDVIKHKKHESIHTATTSTGGMLFT